MAGRMFRRQYRRDATQKIPIPTTIFLVRGLDPSYRAKVQERILHLGTSFSAAAEALAPAFTRCIRKVTGRAYTLPLRGR